MYINNSIFITVLFYENINIIKLRCTFYSLFYIIEHLNIFTDMDPWTFYGRAQAEYSNDSDSPDNSDEDFTLQMSDDDINDTDELSDHARNSSSDEAEEEIEVVSIPAMSDWGSVISKPRSFIFSGKEEMTIQPINADSTVKPRPIDIYNLFITDEVIDLIVRETNSYAQQIIDASQLTHKSRLQAWTETS